VDIEWVFIDTARQDFLIIPNGKMVKAFFCKYIPPFESGSWNFGRLKLEVGIKLFFFPTSFENYTVSQPRFV